MPSPLSDGRCESATSKRARDGRLSETQLRWPAAPPRTFAAVGHNNNRLWVVPEWQMVIVRLGLDQADRRLTADGENLFFNRLAAAVRD
jgi:hypothetical protein